MLERKSKEKRGRESAERESESESREQKENGVNTSVLFKHLGETDLNGTLLLFIII